MRYTHQDIILFAFYIVAAISIVIIMNTFVVARINLAVSNDNIAIRKIDLQDAVEIKVLTNEANDEEGQINTIADITGQTENSQNTSVTQNETEHESMSLYAKPPKPFQALKQGVDYRNCPISMKKSNKGSGSQSTKLANNTRVILPILKWGPTNQIAGFYETRKIAEFLDSKMVIPPFYLTNHDEKWSQEKFWSQPEKLLVPAKIRVNVDELEDSNEAITLGQFKKHCSDNKDFAILLTDSDPMYLYNRIRLFERITKIDILAFAPGHDWKYKPKDRNVKFGENMEIYPDINIFKKNCEGIPLNDKTWIKSNWKKYYTEAAKSRKCLVLLGPYRTIGKNDDINQDIPLDADFNKPVKAIAKKFLEKYGKMTLGLHWRYNEQDWSKRCTNRFVERTLRENPIECKYMKDLSYDKLARQLMSKARNITDDKMDKSNQTTYLYLASPPAMNLTMKRMAKYASSHTTNGNITFLYQKHLLELLDENFKSCKWLNLYRNEIASLAEQAILVSSKEFIYFSLDSSWGRRIIDRRARLKEENIHDGNYKVSYVLDLLKSSVSKRKRKRG